MSGFDTAWDAPTIHEGPTRTQLSMGPIAGTLRVPVIDIYLDLSDPASARFTAANGDLLQSWADAERVTVTYNPVVLHGGDDSYAMLAASAAATVAVTHRKHYVGFVRGILEVQDPTLMVPLPLGGIIDVAEGVGIDVDAALRDAFSRHAYAGWLRERQDRFTTQGLPGAAKTLMLSPTVLVDGVPLAGNLLTSDELERVITPRL